jgi:hypothetical protein
MHFILRGYNIHLSRHSTHVSARNVSLLASLGPPSYFSPYLALVLRIRISGVTPPFPVHFYYD